MTNATPADKDFLRQIEPVVTQTLTREFSRLPAGGQQAVQRQTLLACLNIHRKAKKQRLNLPLFVRRVVREQVLVWLAAHGTPPQQATAMNQIMVQNRKAVADFLSQKRYRFRTTDVADEVLNDSFEAFFTNLSLQKPVKALVSTSIMSIAHFKALHQLREERTDPAGKWAWLETTFVTVEDHEIGSLYLPIGNPDEEEISLTLHLPVADETATPTTVRVELGRLRRWVAECFAKLSSKRQWLIRLRHQFWTQQELKLFTQEEVETLFDDLGMADIARLSSYTNAHTASVRLNESREQLRHCLTIKLTDPAA